MSFFKKYTRRTLNKLSKREKTLPYGTSERGFQTKNCFKDMFDILGKPKIIFDVGAWEGDSTEIFLSFSPNSEVYCFEPDPVRYQQLEKNFKNKDNVYTFNVAIGEKEGVQDLFQFDHSPSNSLMPFKKDAQRYLFHETKILGKSQVNVTTLDKFCETHSIESIDLLKMDIQGNETRLISGAERLLRNKKVNLIFSELIFVELYENQGKYFEIQILLDKFGYSLFDYYNFVYDKNGQLGWGDGIFLPIKSKITGI
ncbi:MAG: FkbM family methyltransferase [Thaumarchaeota archaeon]|nr:FkbM family methyltransferase [Nitrososphaerota archaeon]